MEFVDEIPKQGSEIARLRDSKPNLIRTSVHRLPPAVSEWLREGDQPWSWTGSGRSGGVWEPGSSSGFPLTGEPTSSVSVKSASGISDFFSGEGGQRAEVRPGNQTRASLLEQAPLESNGFIANSSVRGNPYPRIASVSSPHWDYSYGQAIINWAREVLHIELLPWQQFLLLEGCARVNDRFKYRTLLTVVARQNGKTLLAAIRILGGMVLFGEGLVVGAAQNLVMSLQSWTMAYEMAEAAGLQIQQLRLAQGGQFFTIGPSKYRVIASTAGAARGISGVDLIVMDEIRQLKNWDAYAAIDKTRRARPDSQLWAITTEGDLTSEVLNRLQESARNSIQDGKDSPLGYWEWSAPPGAHPGRPETWAQANPCLGWTLDESTVRAEYETDPASVFEVEVLCRKVSSLQAWVRPSDFDDCSTDQPFPIDKPFVIAVDAGPELRHVSIVAGSYADGFSAVELVAQYVGPLALTSAERRLEALLSRWKPYALVTLHKSPVEASVAAIAEEHNVEHLTVRPADWARACRAFYASVNQRTIQHPGGPGISAALGATKRGPDGLVSSVHRVNAEADIDAAIAAVLAMWVPTQQPAPPQIPEWTVY